MAIVNEGQTVSFTSPDPAVQPLRHPLVSWYETEKGTPVAAVWETDEAPYAGSELVYFLYEGDGSIRTHARSDYLYWHVQGLAGFVLKPHLRARLGLGKSIDAVMAGLGDLDANLTPTT